MTRKRSRFTVCLCTGGCVAKKTRITYLSFLISYHDGSSSIRLNGYRHAYNNNVIIYMDRMFHYIDRSGGEGITSKEGIIYYKFSIVIHIATLCMSVNKCGPTIVVPTYYKGIGRGGSKGSSDLPSWGRILYLSIIRHDRNGTKLSYHF